MSMLKQHCRLLTLVDHLGGMNDAENRLKRKTKTCTENICPLKLRQSWEQRRSFSRPLSRTQFREARVSATIFSNSIDRKFYLHSISQLNSIDEGTRFEACQDTRRFPRGVFRVIDIEGRLRTRKWRRRLT